MDRETRSWFERIEKWQREHLDMHKEEAQERKTTRRWIISSVIIPTIAALIGAVSIIITIAVASHP